MAIITDQSYGVVPFYRSAAGARVLLVHQIGRRGDRFWTLPKGHAEEGESPEAAALRELAEETGLTAITLALEHSFSMQYQFIFEGDTIDKTVTFFLGYADDQQTSITQPEEIAALGWFTKEEALAKVSHTEVQRILEDAFVAAGE